MTDPMTLGPCEVALTFGRSHMITGPKDHSNIRILQSGCKAQFKTRRIPETMAYGSLCVCGLSGTYSDMMACRL